MNFNLLGKLMCHLPAYRLGIRSNPGRFHELNNFFLISLFYSDKLERKKTDNVFYQIWKYIERYLFSKVWHINEDSVRNKR